MTPKYRLFWFTSTSIDDIKAKGNTSMLWQIPESHIFYRIYIIHLFGSTPSRVFYHKKGSNIIHVDLANFSGLKNPFLIITAIVFSILRVFSLLNIFIRDHRLLRLRATDPFVTGFFGFIFSVYYRLPYYISIHSDYFKYIKLGIKPCPLPVIFLKLLFFFNLTFCTKVLPISHYILTKTSRYYPFPGFLRNKMSSPIYHYLLDQSLPPLTNSSKFSSNDILITARLSPEKGSMYIPKILEELLFHGWRGRFHIYGSGPLFTQLSQTTPQEHATFYGLQSESTIHYAHESYLFKLCLCDGASLIEAFMHGCIPICTPNEWHPEIVHNSINGFLSPSSNPASVARVISQALSLSYEQRTHFAQHSRQTYLASFALESILNIRMKAYDLL